MYGIQRVLHVHLCHGVMALCLGMSLHVLGATLSWTNVEWGVESVESVSHKFSE